MQRYPETVASESPDHGPTVRNRVKTGGMLLALAAAVTAGTFLTARHNGWGAHARPVAHVAVVSAIQAGSGAADVPATVPVARQRSRPLTSPTLYLTGSDAEAATAQAELDAAGTMMRTGGGSAATVIVVSPGDDATMRQAIDDQNRARATFGLPVIAVVYLRTATTATGNTTSPAQRAIADENGLRVSLGLPEITAVDTDQVARQAIADENQLRVSLGLPELTALD
jgi:hypothetical protein